MSGRGDNFLARWSRRKREVGEEEHTRARDDAALENHAPLPPPLGVGEGEEPQPQHPLPSPTPGPSPQGGGESAEPLPSLDDLTAESDLSAFLREGVPEALKKAALRRMWSLDPAIRDHVGLAEYAWDFNDPASIPGFGAVAAGTPMAQLAASVMSGQGKTTDPSGDPTPVAVLPESGVATPPPLLDRAASSGPDDGAAALNAQQAAANAAIPSAHANTRAVPPGEMGAPEPHEPRWTADKDPESPRDRQDKPIARHGGAMPR